MLSRLPHELLLNIFHLVYFDPWFGIVARLGDLVLRLEDTAIGIRVNFSNSYDEKIYAGALSCLDAAVFGEGVAAAAAEALYRSEFTFSVRANILPIFLQNCPLSKTVRPGRYIRKLNLDLTKDPNFIGAGKTGQDLRKADCVDLVPGSGDDSTTGSTKHTQLMRKCWRAILNMPRLQKFDFFIMISQDPALRRVIQRFEIRDIIPTHYRLFWRNIHARIYFQLPHAKGPLVPLGGNTAWMVPPGHFQFGRGGFFGSYVDMTCCIPPRWAKPTAQLRAEAKITAARFGGTLDHGCPERAARERLHAVHVYDAFRDYHRRLAADEGRYLSSIPRCRTGR